MIQYQKQHWCNVDVCHWINVFFAHRNYIDPMLHIDIERMLMQCCFSIMSKCWYNIDPTLGATLMSVVESMFFAHRNYVDPMLQIDIERMLRQCCSNIPSKCWYNVDLTFGSNIDATLWSDVGSTLFGLLVLCWSNIVYIYLMIVDAILFQYHE